MAGVWFGTEELAAQAMSRLSLVEGPEHQHQHQHASREPEPAPAPPAYSSTYEELPPKYADLVAQPWGTKRPLRRPRPGTEGTQRPNEA